MITEVNKFIFGILGSIISGMTIVLYREKRLHKKKLEELEILRKKDLDAILIEIKETNKCQSKEIKEIKDSLKKVNIYLDSIGDKNTLKRNLQKLSTDIIKHNSDLKENKALSGMITLLTAGRNHTIELGTELVDIVVKDMDKITLRDDIYSIFNELKLLADTQISANFSKGLRKDTEIKLLVENLITNLWEVKSGKYNGDTFKQLNITLSTFLESMYTAAIKYWREVYKRQIKK
jgi:hypothetical protein